MLLTLRYLSQRGQFFINALPHGVKLPVKAIQLHQFGLTAHFFDTLALQHHDRIGVVDGRKAGLRRIILTFCLRSISTKCMAEKAVASCERLAEIMETEVATMLRTSAVTDADYLAKLSALRDHLDDLLVRDGFYMLATPSLKEKNPPLARMTDFCDMD